MKKLLSGTSGDKKLLLGNEAIVRGALEAGVGMISCYPGTPSSEVVDAFYRLGAQMLEAGETPGFHAEYSINEKVAMELACGAALGGAKSLVAMKHVGLNVAADPLFTAAYIGLPGGLVVLSADDPGCHSSQNEQDNRQYARFAGLPCFEPSSPQEALEMTISAFELARGLEQPVMLRSTTRVSHSRGPVQFGDPTASGDVVPFRREPRRFVPVPAVALKRHRILAANMEKARMQSEKSPYNTVRRPKGATGKSRGVIASGIARAYLADALRASGLEDEIAVLELGQTWPLPTDMIHAFLRTCGEVLVLEEGAPLLEKDIRSLGREAAPDCQVSGKDAWLTEFGEYSTSLVRSRLDRWLNLACQASEAPKARQDLPGRPPNLCPGCPHRSVYYAARKVFGEDAVYSSDIGCYTLGLLPPLQTADFLLCMGSSVSAGSGFSRASGRTVVGFIGDSTFFHSGMTGLANAVFNRHDLLLVILDNGTTAMTGQQPNPGVNQEELGAGATHLDIESIVRGLGVANCLTVKSHNLASVIGALESLRQQRGVRVLIARETCLLRKRKGQKKKKIVVAEVLAQNEAGESCLRELACPAFTRLDGRLAVDENLCGGCMVCLQIAPTAFGAKKIA